MTWITIGVRFLVGVSVGIVAGDFVFARSANAYVDCDAKESVELKFESASLAKDESFWRSEFSPLDDPNLFDARTLANNALMCRDGWWRLEHEGDQ